MAIVALAALLLSGGAGAEGVPTITFLSEAAASGDYVLEVSVTGDLDPGEVYYGVDTVDVTIPMTHASGDLYTATIDTTALEDGSHTITVKALNTTGEVATEDLGIDVDNHSPVVWSTSLSGAAAGDYLFTGTAEDVYLNASAVYALIDDDFDASKDNLMTWVDDHFEFTVDTTTLEDGVHLVRIWAFDLWGNNNKSRAVGIDVDNTPPEVALLFGGGFVSGEVTIEVSYLDDHLNETTVYYVIDGDRTGALGNPMYWTGEGFTATLDTTTLAAGDHRVSVLAIDDLGNEAETGEVAFRVDNTPPEVTITSSGGSVWGDHTLKATVTDENLNESCVMAKVGNADPVAMVMSGTDWQLLINTTLLGSGEVTVVVVACDLAGNTNDTEAVVLTVQNLPDLVITSYEFTSKKVEEDEDLKVLVTVRNNGYAPATNFDISLVLGGEAIASTVEPGDLAPGDELEYTIKWKAEDPGDHTVTLVVDFAGSVEEIDEGNNAMDGEETIEVKEPSPGMGAVLLALALVTAVLVLRRRR